MFSSFVQEFYDLRLRTCCPKKYGFAATKNFDPFLFQRFFFPSFPVHFCNGARSSTQRNLHESGCGTFLCNKNVSYCTENMLGSRGQKCPKIPDRVHCFSCFFRPGSWTLGRWGANLFFVWGELSIFEVFDFAKKW